MASSKEILTAKVRITYLPKVGDNGLRINIDQLVSQWQFSGRVISFMRRNGISEAWFQTYDKDGWRWGHGIVNQSGRITQWG